ncbi:MAG: Hsp20/alpha crystallin family protein [Pseudomonadota bacterium]
MRQLLTRLFDAAEGGAGNDDSSVVTSQWMPLVDIKEEGEQFVLLADIPGVDPQDIDVQMDKGLLTIKGERVLEARSDNAHFSRTERVHGVFHRRFALPDSADPERITASGRNGVLQIVIPKKPETTPRKIQVGTIQDTLVHDS